MDRESINSSGHRFVRGQKSVQRIYGVTANMKAYGAEVNNRGRVCAQLLGNSNKPKLLFCQLPVSLPGFLCGSY